MARLRSVDLFAVSLLSCGVLLAQDQGKVDFVKDVQPILRQNCVGCHGPMKQNGGLRLDRRSSAMKARRIVAGNSANSMVYHRTIGEFGAPMPPTGDLKPEQVATLKAWIDQGAEWPDSYANEVDKAPFDPQAIAMVGMLRDANLAGFMKAAAAKPALLNARGPEGSTPFMYAVLYTHVPTLARLLKMGADPNKANDANATALMWAAGDLARTQLLIDHGAKVNAMSDDFRTPLMIAARHPGGTPVVKLLLDHGADPNPNRRPDTASSPLLEAVTAGDFATLELLLQRGALIKSDAQSILSGAMYSPCMKCVDLLATKITSKDVYTGALEDTAVFGNVHAIQLMLDHGADVKAYDVLGRTALMYAAASDLLPLDVIKLLVAHGADVNARSKHEKSGDAGLTVLDIARRHGDTPVLEFLVASGAKPGQTQPAVLQARFKNELRTSIQDSLPLLQRTDAAFSTRSGCISCHSNSLTAMTVGMARKQGFVVDEKTAAAQVKVNVDFLRHTRDVLQQGFLVPVGDNFAENVVSYLLLGLNAEGYKPDLNTDVAAMFILGRQSSTGEWLQPHADTRQPLCLDFIGNTALSMRALQLYAPKTDSAVYRKSIAMAANWLANAQSLNTEDRTWRLIGLAWAGSNKPATQKAMQELLATQKADGGWSDLPSMDSTAYATGKSMVALRIAGLPVSDPAYQRGMKWLLDHQQQDGSWYVQTRAMAFQPDFDAGFPGGHDQWISSAGTNWAAMALTMALPDPKTVIASRGR